ncbi:hypothetical protein QBC39DRAFT_158945 [Podospora conica]|nr:hypothetical protein QBC39DRAFT_158945 [Schizothecium conicum]
MFLRGFATIDSRINSLEYDLQGALGWPYSIDQEIQPHINRLHREEYQSLHDPELKRWLRRKTWSEDSPPWPSKYSIELCRLREKFLTCASELLKCQVSPHEEALTGHWYHPSPGHWHSKVKKLNAACNSFALELFKVAEAANFPNYATLQRSRSNSGSLSQWLSPSLTWAHNFLDRTTNGLVNRGKAMANLLITGRMPYIAEHYPQGYPEAHVPSGDDYYSHRRLVGQNIGGISFEQIAPYFPLWHTVDAMMGVLEDLLGLSFQKLDTSNALGDGIVVYELSEDSKDRQQAKYLGRLYLELARKHPIGAFSPLDHGDGQLWRTRSLAYPEVCTLQSPYDDPVDGVHREGSVIVRNCWSSQRRQGPYLQLDQVEKLFHGIGSALCVLLVKHNRVAFNLVDENDIPDEFVSMVGTVFGRLARHPAVLRRITCHPYYHDPKPRAAHEATRAPAKEMPECMIAGIVKCTQFETLMGTLQSLTGAVMDRKITTIGSMKEAKAFDVERAWNETVEEIQSIKVAWGGAYSTKDYAYYTEARSTFTLANMAQGCSYIIGETIGLDIFTSKLAANGLFDNRREWRRFREMILSLSPTTEPDYMAKIEEYLGRPFNQDIFADCTDEVEEQLKEQLAKRDAWLDSPAGRKAYPIFRPEDHGPPDTPVYPSVTDILWNSEWDSDGSATGAMSRSLFDEEYGVEDHVVEERGARDDADEAGGEEGSDVDSDSEYEVMTMQEAVTA